MKYYIPILACFLLLLGGCAGCGIANNFPTPATSNDNVDFILINNTPYDNLDVYYSKDFEDCTNMAPLGQMKIGDKVPFHVDGGQTVYIRYCSPTDDHTNLCKDCRSKVLIGNSAQHAEVSLN